MDKKFVAIPIYDHNDETVKVNVDNIIDIRVINVGKKPDQAQNWYVQVIMQMGKYYLLREENAPYATKAEVLVARDSFISSFVG